MKPAFLHRLAIGGGKVYSEFARYQADAWVGRRLAADSAVKGRPASVEYRKTPQAMLSETVTLILALAGLLAAAGCVWASWAAYRSVVSAQAVTRHAEKLERRGLLRELTITAHRIIAESSQMELLLEDLKAEYRILATFSGQSGGSRERLLIQRAESKQKEIFPLQEQAQKLLEKRSQFLNVAEEELTQALMKFDGILVQVLRIKDSLEREIAVVAGDNRIHRARRIKALNLPR